jgi:hypothetical protein
MTTAPPSYTTSGDTTAEHVGSLVTPKGAALLR